MLFNLREFLSTLTVEPAMLFFSLSHGFYAIIAQELYVAKVRLSKGQDFKTRSIAKENGKARKVHKKQRIL